MAMIDQGMIKVVVERLQLHLMQALDPELVKSALAEAIEKEVTPEKLTKLFQEEVKIQIKDMLEHIAYNAVRKSEAVMNFLEDTAKAEINRRIDELKD